MGIKRNRRSLWVAISHCWSHGSGSSVVLSAMVSRPHFGSNDCICSGYGSLTGRGEHFPLPVFFSYYPVYMQLRRKLDAAIDTKKEERVKAVHDCFERSTVILKDHPSVLVSFHALSRAEGHRMESNEEVAEVCDLIQEAGYDHPF